MTPEMRKHIFRMTVLTLGSITIGLASCALFFCIVWLTCLTLDAIFR